MSSERDVHIYFQGAANLGNEVTVNVKLKQIKMSHSQRDSEIFSEIVFQHSSHITSDPVIRKWFQN